MRLRRLGRFEVSLAFIQSWKDDEIGIAAELFKGMLILRAEHSFELDKIIYTAAGEMFDEVPKGETIPMYRAVYSSGAFSPKWERVA